MLQFYQIPSPGKNTQLSYDSTVGVLGPASPKSFIACSPSQQQYQSPQWIGRKQSFHLHGYFTTDG
jgi:hypothetical protein